MNMFERFDEIPAMALQDIKESKIDFLSVFAEIFFYFKSIRIIDRII